MRFTLTAILAFLVPLVYGQKLYKDSIYGQVKVTTHKYYTADSEAMEFQYYRANAATGKLPLIIYIHGGGFRSGTNNSQGIQYFAKRLASRGYAVASLSYRLTLKDIADECEITAEQKKQAIDDASFDIITGLKHMLKYDSIFAIDSKRVILVGSSAGGETALNIVYKYDYIKLLSNFKFAGVVSMSGALTSLDHLTQAHAIPTQLFHGTSDEVVPYAIGHQHACEEKTGDSLMMYGSATIAEKLKQFGKPYYLFLITGGTHSWAGVPTKNCFMEIADFLYNDVLFPTYIRKTERVVQEEN